ncbi:enolase C-terminal domain-like protein [Micromonospora rosaria]|uniref:enolase C-terminal domain-like protein n=1 Tax=Micromonospora rosaria TaxID=47874 RepID=UPI0009FD9804|nr:enolase C-terminal domain-like protein [Micromonospora rosaria]
MKLRWRGYPLVLREPLRISRSTMDRRDAVQVSLAHAGVTGHGEVVTSRFLGLDRTRIDTELTGLVDRIAGYPDPTALRADLPALATGFHLGVVAALDAAVHDLLGRLAGQPVHRLVGAPEPGAVPTAYTVGLVAPAAAGVAAGRLAAAGFGVLKVKAGDDHDVARVAAVRAAAPDARLLLDPNGGWTPEQAVRRLDALARYRVEMVEQPVPAGRVDRLAWVAARTPVPVVVDEDAATEADLPRLAGAVAGVNVKLAKCGGIRAATRIVAAAREHGLAVMLGCLVTSSLGIAPALHLAGYARWVDLDGHLLLADDPWTGLGGHDGTLHLTGTPGLGVTPRRRSPHVTPRRPEGAGCGDAGVAR